MPTFDTIKKAITSFPGDRLLASYKQAMGYDIPTLGKIVAGNCNNYCGAMASYLAECGIPCAIVDNLPQHEYLLVISEDNDKQEFIVIDPTISQFCLTIGEEHRPFFVGKFEQYKSLFTDDTVLSNRTKINCIRYPNYTLAQRILCGKKFETFAKRQNILYLPWTVSISGR